MNKAKLVDLLNHQFVVREIDLVILKDNDGYYIINNDETRAPISFDEIYEDGQKIMLDDIDAWTCYTVDNVVQIWSAV